MFMLIAVGPNDIRMPCRFSKKKETLLAFVDGVFPDNKKLSTGQIYVEDAQQEQFDQVFTDYYDGCGEVWAFEIEEVPLDQKVLEWDLD